MRGKKFLSAAVILVLLAVISFGGCKSKPQYSISGNGIKNAILFIGDGMGENHIENTLIYHELDRPAFLSDRAGYIQTASLDDPVTDSAAGATAFSTGQKVDNDEVAYHDGKSLQTITELAKAAGMKVGVVTTDILTGATPAAFTSHTYNRGQAGMIANMQSKTGFDLLIGEDNSSKNYFEKYGELYLEGGYTLAQSAAELEQYKDATRLAAVIPNFRSEYNVSFQDQYQLKDAVEFAIEFLQCEQGYLLIVESAHIDKFSHDKSIVQTTCEVRSAFDAIDRIYSTVSSDTAIIITADHETGGLSLAGDKSQIKNALYSSGSHTGTDVPLFVKNFTFENNSNETPQNTVVFEMLSTLLNLKAA